jgi:hypothetical protein
MPDQDGNVKAGEDETSKTPLHAYKEGREEDIKGDTDKFLSNDPKQLQADEIEDEGEELHAPAKT